MKIKRLALLLLMFIAVSTVAVAQVNDPEQDDPFADDPFFTKPLNEWFVREEIRERARRTSDRIIEDRGIDKGYRDVSGLSQFPGLSEMDKIYPMVRFNHVEALFVGFDVDRKLKWNDRKDLRGFGSIGYSFGQKNAQYSFGIERFFGFSRSMKIGASHQNIIESEDKWRVGWNENSLVTFFTGYDYMDYYSREGTQIYSIFKLGNMIEHTIAFTDDMYGSLERTSRYSMFGKKSFSRENPEIDEGRIQMLVLGGAFNPYQHAITRLFTFSADVMLELSPTSSFSSDYDFTRFQAEMRSSLRIDKSAVLQNRIRVGAIEGAAPDFKHFYLGGISTLRARPFKAISGTHMALANTELHLGRSVGNPSNLDWFDSATNINHLKVSFFADLGWVNSSTSPNDQLFTAFESFNLSKIYSDVGAAINFNLLRLEAAWPASNLSQSPVIWFRLNRTF